MKVLDLACANRHSFEGWFSSEKDFQSQLTRGLVECPLCGDKAIVKLLSAPRFNLGASAPTRADDAPTATRPVESASRDAAMQAAWFKMTRHLIDNTEDVGRQFAETARRIHYGEAEARDIRGQATRGEAESLLDEGIVVMPFVLPPVLESSEH